MPVNVVTCPSCGVTLKPKAPLPEGVRLKCPKCATSFVVRGDSGDVPSTVAAPLPKSPAPKPPAPKPAAPKPPAAADDDLPEATEVIDDDAEASDEEAAPAKAKKKLPLWVWIAGGVGALFLVCCGCGGPIGYFYSYGVPGLGGAAVNDASYKQIKKGMTEADVKKIMGGDPSLTLPVGDMKSETWKGNGEDFITVQFKDGKALAGGFQFTNGPATMKGGGPLP